MSLGMQQNSGLSSSRDGLWQDLLEEFSVSLEDRCRKRLDQLGFQSFPRFTLLPEEENAEPVSIVTGACFSAVPRENSKLVPADELFEIDSQLFLPNQGAATAIALLKAGRRVVLHCCPDSLARATKILKFYDLTENAKIVTGEIVSLSFIASICGEIASFAETQPISRVDLCLYESFTARLSKEIGRSPFIPIFEEPASDLRKLVADRGEFFLNFLLFAFDLILNRGQKELRIISISALAAARPAGHLAVDALHKVVGSTLLRTFPIDLSQMAISKEITCNVIEVMPGIVFGGYNRVGERLATAMRRERGAPSFAGEISGEIEDFPTISPGLVAEAASLYQLLDSQADLSGAASPELLALTFAGRSQEVLFSAFEGVGEVSEAGGRTVLDVSTKLPSYCLLPGSRFGALPPLRGGYIPVPLTPSGQLF